MIITVTGERLDIEMNINVSPKPVLESGAELTDQPITSKRSLAVYISAVILQRRQTGKPLGTGHLGTCVRKAE